MKFSVLALDYDGTVARDGVLDGAVRAAIGEARHLGIVVVLVTGRILADLRRVAGDLGFVDAVVAENGAVLCHPATGRTSVLGGAPPAGFVEELRGRGIEVLAGECIVEAEAAAAAQILSVVRRRELPLVLLFNRGRLMVLPQGISKATGLERTLSALRLSPRNAIGIGDAENDHELLRVCEVGVAVSWGSRALRETADEVIEGEGPPAVARYILEASRRARLPETPARRRRLLLGTAADGSPMYLAVRGRNVLVAGDPKSGKSWVAGLLCEQLILQGYCVCVVDPEGDYVPLEALPGVVVAGGEDPPPRPRELLRALRHPDMSLVLDLSRLGHEAKVDYMRALLPGLAALRRETGLPHRILVDEAHYFLQGPEPERLLDLELAGYTLVTYRASALHPDVLAAGEAILVTRETDPREVEALRVLCSARQSHEAWARVLGGLELAEAALLPGAEETGRALAKFRIAPRFTHHVRHRAKYLDVPVPAGQAFVFHRNGLPSGRSAATLQEFVEILGQSLPRDVDGHLRRGDFSRWLGDVFGDHPLAEQVREVEEQYSLHRIPEAAAAVAALIRDRYHVPQPPGSPDDVRGGPRP